MALRQFWLILSGFLFFVGNAAAQGWTLHKYPEDSFQVEFPQGAEVKKTPIQISPETAKVTVRTVQYLYDGGAVAYLVGLNIVTTSIDFDKGVTASFGSLKCNTTLSDTTLKVEQARGRELRGTDCSNGSFRTEARYFTFDKSFYQVLALYRMGGDGEAAARHFVESFKLNR